MRALAVITLDGVLRDTETSGPIEEGQALYHCLSYLYRLAIIVTGPDDETWLDVNGFQAHQLLVAPRHGEPGDVPIRRLRQLQALRADGERVTLLVDPDPSVIATCHRTGVTGIHYVHPIYARPEHLPDHDATITPWDQMVAELDRTRAMKAADRRPLEE
ncbi:hypothetical protein ACWDTT_15985 [Streptosporangium sandarakinum]